MLRGDVKFQSLELQANDNELVVSRDVVGSRDTNDLLGQGTSAGGCGDLAIGAGDSMAIITGGMYGRIPAFPFPQGRSVRFKTPTRS